LVKVTTGETIEEGRLRDRLDRGRTSSNGAVVACGAVEVEFVTAGAAMDQQPLAVA
jgi:hypothetical protein